MSRLRRRVAEQDPISMVVLEHRLLIAFTICAAFGIIIWIVAVSTNYWFSVTSPHGPIYMNRTNTYFIRSHSGLWKICKTIGKNGSYAEANVMTWCHYLWMWPTEEQIAKNPEVDRTYLDYTRTEAAFSIISFGLMVMSIGFSLYTFKEPRYMFKRLAGGVYFITAAAILVVIEVLSNSVKYEEQSLAARHPKGTQWSYGFSYGIAWFTFVIYTIAGIAFLICSRKRKGDKAGSEYQAREDQPNILGR